MSTRISLPRLVFLSLFLIIGLFGWGSALAGIHFHTIDKATFHALSDSLSSRIDNLKRLMSLDLTRKNS